MEATPYRFEMDHLENYRTDNTDNLSKNQLLQSALQLALIERLEHLVASIDQLREELVPELRRATEGWPFPGERAGREGTNNRKPEQC